MPLVHNKEVNLRLVPSDAIALAMLAEDEQVVSLKYQMEAFALTANFWRNETKQANAKVAEVQDAEMRMQVQSELHQKAMLECGSREQFIARLDQELVWRANNPEFDPNDPFQAE